MQSVGRRYVQYFNFCYKRTGTLWGVLEHVTEGRLVQVLEDWWSIFSGYHLYYPSRRQTSPVFDSRVNALRRQS